MLLATARVAIVAMTMAAMARADPFKTVHINDAGSYVSGSSACSTRRVECSGSDDCAPTNACQCLILPEHKMDIGASEYDGGAGSYCIDPKKNGQRQLPQGIWKNGGPFVVRGSDNGDYIQLTGTFDADMVPVLNPHDAGGGGQYDSNGGSDGRGNPRDSRCKGCEWGTCRLSEREAVQP